MAKKLKYNTYSEVTELYGNSEEATRANFLLTVIQRKQGQLKYTFEDNFVGVYFSNGELRDILGNDSYKARIEEYTANGLLTPVKGMLSGYYRKLYYFEPVTFTSHKTEIPRFRQRAFTGIISFYDHKKKDLSPEAKIILSNLRHTKIHISYDRFYELVEANYPSYRADKMRDGKTPVNLSEYLIGYEYLWERIIEFNGASGLEYYDFISEDSFGKRVHTIISQLPKFLKNEGVIYIDGMPCKESDLRQSQPSFLSLALSLENPENDFTKTFDTVDDIYLHLTRELRLESRDHAKNILFTMMFGTNYGKWQRKFNELFPVAGQLLRNIKSTPIEANPSKKIHSNVAFQMQRAESEIFREIWVELKKARIRFVTIHDSVIMPAERYEQGLEIMIDTLQKYLLNPQIH